MNAKTCSFLIVCLLAACKAPRQVVSPPPVAIQAPPVVVKFEHTIAVPAIIDSAIVQIPCDTFSLLVDFEKTRVKIEPTGDGKHKVTSERKEDEITVTVVDSVTVLTLRYPGIDSVFVIAGRDTSFSHAVKNDLVQCPPTLPAAPTGDGFPIGYVLVVIFVMTLWWIGRQRRKE